jgi:hypothetical protein
MIGEMLAAACRDPEVLARLGGPLGEEARASTLPSKQARAMAMAAARAPAPANLRGIHGTWIEAALAGLPARARVELAAGGMRDRVAVWLARWASAALAPMPAAELSRPRTIQDAAKLRADDLARWLSEVGADQLAFAVGGDLGGRLAAAHARIARPPRAGRLGERRAAIARCEGERDDELLVLIGARTIAPYTDAIVRRQIALRFPRTRGERILFELAKWAETAASASWDAIIAD